ncbi:glucokinase [Pseudosulfitobacter koreensis]|uniref:Glucokinase n=1 Tax=Pseudosulfitobacter koreensis TaxID=2968472 RepID=A0ABT1Z3V0_9RHOB|nr:glucokinase [Pseudosulfitobacter koreense]MCR8827790.1 glucokinase [Pseudosulfitobacter koreense]
MRWVVADVGGTNTRMAFAQDGKLVTGSVQWFLNDDYPTFADVLVDFVQDAPVDGLCVAIAGPVMPGHVRLTNRDWSFDADQLSMVLGGAKVRIINDLAAVGHALPYLAPDAVVPVVPGRAAPGGQSLVVGIGTGFNVSLAHGNGVMLAEEGHTGLSIGVWRVLQDHLGEKAAAFETVEQVFSGSGLRALHLALGGVEMPSQQIVRDARLTMGVFVTALAALVRDMTFQFMPLGGIYFNGGLARAVVGLPETGEILAAARVQDMFEGTLSDIPMCVVVDDAAALAGCVACLERT